MPALSPTMTKGHIGQWKVDVGSSISTGDVLVEVETDKATMDLESPEDGFLARIFQKQGTKDVQVGAPLAMIAFSKEDVSSLKNAPAPDQEDLQKEVQPEQSNSTFNQPETKIQEESKIKENKTTKTTDRVKASPYAKSLAQKANVDLSTINGSGPDGRIVAADLSHLQKQQEQSSTVQMDHTDVPLSNMRRVIAERLSYSKQSIPHYTVSMSISVKELERIRKRLNEATAVDQKDHSKPSKVSINDFVIKAAARALMEMPEMNSSWTDQNIIRQFHNANISVAVALPQGLVTPVIRNAESKGLGTISEEMKSLVAQAKANKLSPSDYQGGTFTISNLGGFGVDIFSAIINPPQAAILAVGVTKRIIVPDPTTNAPVVDHVMMVTLSCDHRVVDGAVAAQWLQKFKSFMEDPVAMIL